MSTKSSYFYHDDGTSFLHFYEDLADPDKFFLEKSVTTEVKYQFTLEELCLLAKSIDMDELRRQSNITNDEIEAYVKETVQKRIDHKDSFFGWFGFTVYGGALSPKEDQIQAGITHYQKVRDSLQTLVSKLDNKKISKISFGMF
jgi:hypothetical protein